MKLVSSSNSSDTFELSILGYGNVTRTWRDRNRLQCQFSTFWRQKADTQSAPLQTWEIKQLLNSLQQLWTKTTRRVTLAFPEPGLRMEARVLPNDAYSLQILLEKTLTPAWHPYPDFPMEIDMVLNREQLQEAIQELAQQIESYPER